MAAQEEKLFKKLGRKMALTIREHNLLEDGDRLLLGLSGGKDSMIMLELLADRIKAFPFHVEMFAVHIVPEDIGYEVDLDYIKKFAIGLEVDLKIIRIRPDLEKSDKSACFICSWERRKAIFDYGKELNCNKLAFGHHRDDALQTFMMNLLYHGSISSLPYSLSMFEGRVKLIRPLMDIWEQELINFSKFRKFDAVSKYCPHENLSKRNYTKNLIDEISKSYPASRINMFHALDNIYTEYLPKSKKSSSKDSGQIMQI